MIFDLAECEEIACHSFADKQLLRTAFTHTSYAHEHHAASSYERLEFLGDALLDFLVAEHLYRTYPEMEEGEMTTLRAKLVSKPALKQIAENLNMGNLVLLGEGGEKSGERKNDKILSSLIESLIAAVYLDGGIDAARRFAAKRVLPEGNKVFAKVTDYKTELQEYVQKRKLGAILYTETGRTGPAHSPVFSVTVSVKGKVIAEGKGGKKQAAEQEAAKIALSQLKAGTPETKGKEKSDPYTNVVNRNKKWRQYSEEIESYLDPPPWEEMFANRSSRQPQEKGQAASGKKTRTLRERPIPKNKPEKKKSFSAFAGGAEAEPPKEKRKKEKQKTAKPLFAKKHSKGGDGTPL